MLPPCASSKELTFFLSIKTILFDLDGTLLRPDATLDPDDARRINALTDAGFMISYATARTIQSVKHILADIHFTEHSPPIALMNGVFIRDMARGEYLDCASFSRETAEHLLTAFENAVRLVHLEFEFVGCSKNRSEAKQDINNKYLFPMSYPYLDFQLYKSFRIWLQV